MYKNYWLIILLLLLGVETHADERNLFNNAWRFYRGDEPQAMKVQFSDEHWRMVDLPHDWRLTPDSLKSIEVSSDTVGWYRKTFTIAPSDTARIVYLCFERIHGKADIWLNGTLIHSTSCSYEPIKIDVTPHLRDPYRLNQLAIRVANAPMDSTFYIGAGITHDTWFIRTNRIHLDAWETQVKAIKVSSRRGRRHADLQISTLIHNTDTLKEKGHVRISIVDSEDKSVYDEIQATHLTDSTIFKSKVTLRNPKCWYTDSPEMYRATLYIGMNDTVCDSITIPFGINVVEYTEEMGLVQNDETPLIQGAMLEHNERLTGYTAFRRAEALLVQHMQTYGFTAVRCPMGLLSEHFLNACDTLGVMVFVDASSPIHQTEQWSERATLSHIKRYRNHPSIAMWCISDSTHERELVNTVDDSRPIAIADILLDYPWSDQRSPIGDLTPLAYRLNAERLVNSITMGISAPDTLHTDSTVWLPEVQHWTWPGYEGSTMKVNIYSKNDWVSLYLNNRLIDNVKPDKVTHSATLYLPYTPGKLDAVTSIDRRKLWQPKVSKSKIKIAGRSNDHFILFTEGEARYVHLSADCSTISNANGELCFVKIDILDADGNILSDGEVPLLLHIRGPGAILSSGNSQGVSSSLLTIKTHQGSALVVIRPFKKEVGTIRLTATAEGIDIGDVPIKVTE